MKRPKVITKCVADQYSGPRERIVEFSHGGKGGLISLMGLDDGTLIVNVYCVDKGVKVVGPGRSR